jgi:predicted permease
LVVGQIGLTAGLLFGATLLTRSFAELVRVPPGFSTRNTLTFSVELPRVADRDPREAGDFFEGLRSRLGSLPGALDATVASDLPFTIWNNYKGFRPLEMDAEREDVPSVESRTVAANYFDVMGIPLLSGRTFSSEDGYDGPLAFVVNRQMAEFLWPGEDPLGRQAEISLRREPATGTVVGVVADILDDGPRGEHEPRFYLSYEQDPKTWGSIILTSSVEALSLVQPARRAVGELNGRVPVTEVVTMEALVRESTFAERVLSGLAAAFGSLALLLAAVGIYGVMAYSVSERRREIGIRTALGAKRSEVTGLVMLRAFRMSLVGAFGGMALALAFGQVLASLLFGVTPRDPVSFLITFTVLGGVALLAAWVPAQQAGRVDPMVAMRAE